jgi:diketogulonate reductase-like aldo/keto reductase
MIVKLLKILVPTLVLAVAIFIGWLNTFPIPEGAVFSMVYPIMKGFVPPAISGGYKECPVVPLLEGDKTLEPRPAKETFVILPGYVPPPVVEPPAAQEEAEEESTGEESTGEKATDEATTPEEIPVDPSLAQYQIPQQGIGMCCRYTAYDAESVRRTILWYLKVGGRHIDTADLYLNHQWIGQALQIAIQDYGIPREEIWVTTKLWPRAYGTNTTLEAIPRMLKELQLDYLDLVLMHAPAAPTLVLGQQQSDCAKEKLSPKECRQETWKALSTFTESGVVRHIGVSNFNIRQLKELMELENVAPIANNQFQYNPWVSDAVHETFDFCQKEGISVTAWGSFMGSSMQHMEAFSAETLQKIAQAHDTTVPQVLLKWGMQRGAIVIPGTANPKHMRENLKAFDIELTEEEVKEIDSLRTDESAKKFFHSIQDDS